MKLSWYHFTSGSIHCSYHCASVIQNHYIAIEDHLSRDWWGMRLGWGWEMFSKTGRQGKWESWRRGVGGKHGESWRGAGVLGFGGFGEQMLVEVHQIVIKKAIFN